MYTRDTVVAVRPFLRQPDGEEVIIGNAENGVFLAVPLEVVELLDHLAQGKSVGEASDLYQQKHGETPDMDDFLGLLETKGIVGPAGSGGDGTEVVVRSEKSARPRYHFSNFPQHVARRLFSLPVCESCLAVIALALWLVARNPSLLPVPRDLYFPDHRALSLTLLVAASYFTIFLHELAHLIAARAAGVNSR